MMTNEILMGNLPGGGKTIMISPVETLCNLMGRRGIATLKLRESNGKISNHNISTQFISEINITSKADEKECVRISYGVYHNFSFYSSDLLGVIFKSDEVIESLCE